MTEASDTFTSKRPVCPNCGHVMVVVEDTVLVGKHQIEYLLFCETCLHTELVIKEKEK